MKTFLGVCLQEHKIVDGEKTFILERGREYILSVPNKRDEVTVFSKYWASGVPVSIFGELAPGPGDPHTGSTLNKGDSG